MRMLCMLQARPVLLTGLAGAAAGTELFAAVQRQPPEEAL